MLFRSSKIPLVVENLNELMQPCILPTTPDVLSMGRRCIDKGYSFWWPCGSHSPSFILPDESVVHCTVIDYTPYILDDDDDGRSKNQRLAAPALLGVRITVIPTTAQVMITQLVRELQLPPSNRAAVAGQAICLGATLGKQGPYVTPTSPQQLHLAQLINLCVTMTMPASFEWTSLQINYNTASAPHRDSKIGRAHV